MVLLEALFEEPRHYVRRVGPNNNEPLDSALSKVDLTAAPTSCDLEVQTVVQYIDLV